MINFVLNSQVQPIEDVIEQSTANTDRDEFLESSETAEIYRSRGASAEAAWDDDLPPPEEDESLEERFIDPESKDGQVFNMASKLVFDFRRGVGDHAKRGDERTERNRQLIPFAKQRLEEGRREAENMTPEQISAHGLDTAGSLNYNFTSAGIDFARIDDLPINVRLGIATLLEMYERLPNGTWKGTQRFFGNMMQDPMLAVGGVGGFKVVQKLLKLGGGKALASKLLQSAARSAGYGAYAAEGSAYGAMSEYMMQRLAHDPEKGEFKPDYAKIFTVAGIGAVAAPAIAAAPAVARGVKNVAPVVRDLFDTAGQSRSTLTSGVGPVPATAADEVSAPAPVFFSAVSNAVDALPMEKGSAQQMRAMIAKSEGVKPEEMAWTGLDDFLKGKKSVTKAEVQEYMQANEVKIEEVTLPRNRDVGIKSSEDYRAELEEMSDERLAQEAVNEFGFDFEEVLADITDGVDDYIDDLVGAFSQTLRGRGLDDAGRLEDRTKFGEYTLPGGENYREVLLTLPETRGTTISDAEKARLLELTTKRLTNSLNSFTDAERDEYITLVGKNEGRGQFRSPHFDEPNVLAHMRLNDRTGPDGEKILFIEEIQSDWHQKGRKQCYRDEKAVNEFEQYSRELAAKYNLNPNHNLAMHRTLSGMDDAEVAKYEELQQRVYQSTGNAGVPDAPLKKTWHEMSFRRVARMAAEEGYDAIGWTPGKVQARRYDLSKQLDAVRIEKIRGGEKDGQYLVRGRRGAITEPFFTKAVSEKELPDLIGKDLAEKAIKEAPKYDDGIEYTGVDLQVGGEGIKGFYDKILKNYAAKWGKKFGSKVGVTKIARDYPEMADDKKLLDDLGVEATGSPHHEVWSMPVTKKMRDSVLKKGVPLFGAAGVAGGAATSDTSESPDI